MWKSIAQTWQIVRGFMMTCQTTIDPDPHGRHDPRSVVAAAGADACEQIAGPHSRLIFRLGSRADKLEEP